MSVCLETAQGGQLNYPNVNFKPDCTAAGTYQYEGYFQAAFVRVPWLVGNGSTFLWGFDSDDSGTATANLREHALTILRPNAGGAPRRMANQAYGASSGGALWATANWTAQNLIKFGQVAHPDPDAGLYLIAHGVINVSSTPGTPDWRAFRVCWPKSGGGAGDWEITANAASINTYAAFVGRTIDRIFNEGAGWPSDAEMRVEHKAIMRGNFPLSAFDASAAIDTTALQALIDGTTFNGQTCDSWTAFATAIGGDCLDWRKLVDGDLTDSSGKGNADLTVTGTVRTDAGVIQRSWSSLSVRGNMRGALAQFWGGRGSIAPRVWGTASGAPAVEYRLVDWATKTTAVAGHDWQTLSTVYTGNDFVGTLGGGVPTGGPYAMQVRLALTPAVVADLGQPIYSGTTVINKGQSQGEIGFAKGAPSPAEAAALSASSLVFAVLPIDGGTGDKSTQAAAGTAYSPIQPGLFRIASGYEEGYGALTAAANLITAEMPDEPVMLVSMNWEGIGIHTWKEELDEWQAPGVPAAGGAKDAGTDSHWYIWGDGSSFPSPIPGVGGGNYSGLVTFNAYVCDGLYDVGVLDWGTSDSSGTYADDLPTNLRAIMDAYKSTYFTRTLASAPLIMCPFGRYNTNSGLCITVRNNDAAFGVGLADADLGTWIPDIFLNGAGSPHQRAGYATDATAGVSKEAEDEGNQRRWRYLAASVVRHLNPAYEAMGPRPVKFWRDAADAKVAWIETGWAQGLKTQDPANQTANVVEVYVAPAGDITDFTTRLGSTDIPGGAARTITATIDPAYPTRLKLVRVDGLDWATSGMACEIGYSQLFDTSGTIGAWEEPDTGTPGSRALDYINAYPFGDCAYDGGRGLPMRPHYGTGLVQTTAPTADTFKLKLTERREAGTFPLTVRVKDSAGNVLATKDLSAVLT